MKGGGDSANFICKVMLKPIWIKFSPYVVTLVIQKQCHDYFYLTVMKCELLVVLYFQEKEKKV